MKAESFDVRKYGHGTHVIIQTVWGGYTTAVWSLDPRGYDTGVFVLPDSLIVRIMDVVRFARLNT